MFCIVQRKTRRIASRASCYHPNCLLIVNGFLSSSTTALCRSIAIIVIDIEVEIIQVKQMNGMASQKKNFRSFFVNSEM